MDGEYSRRLRELASKFEQDVEEAKQAVGLEAAIEEWTVAQLALREVVSAMCGLRARTPAGIALKVRATSAYAAIGNDERFRARMWISDAIWNDLAEEV